MCLYNDSRVQSYILTTSKQHTNYEKVRPEKMKLDELQIHLWSVDTSSVDNSAQGGMGG